MNMNFLRFSVCMTELPTLRYRGIEHTLHTGDICIIPPHTTHSVGIFDDSVAFNILGHAAAFSRK